MFEIVRGQNVLLLSNILCSTENHRFEALLLKSIALAYKHFAWKRSASYLAKRQWDLQSYFFLVIILITEISDEKPFENSK